MRIKRALISVSDKRGIVKFARGLAAAGVEIISTGGTANLLSEVGIPVRGISDLTNFPEMLDGRVKTLHPAVHGGILARREVPEHMATLAEHGIDQIDLVVVNLYPFAATVAKPGCSLFDAIENIDIGGPAMIRSAAKNHSSVTVVVRPEDYENVLMEVRDNAGETSLDSRQKLAARAYAHTARYDSMIAQYLQQQFCPDEFPDEFSVGLEKVRDFRYGENPHQSAALYRETNVLEPCISTATVVREGKGLSSNNVYDLNAALATVKEFVGGGLYRPAAVIIKHANPCGAALGNTLEEAFLHAREGDPISAFGGILALTMPVDVSTANAITGKNTFFEAIIAPGYEPEAVSILTEKKKWGKDLRLLSVGQLPGWRDLARGWDMKRVEGGLIVQTRDLEDFKDRDLKTVTDREPTTEELNELKFAWSIVKHVKSNAIVLTKDLQIVGVGAGQMNRVRSVKLAVEHAGEKAKGAVLASDAFFPFPDGPETAAQAGITAIIQPGGSVKDQETIDVCNRYNIAMVFTEIRHFLH